MRRNWKKHLSTILAFVLILTSMVGSNNLLTVNAENDATIALTQADVDRITGAVSLSRVSVHDPSIVNTSGDYYIFGSHMGVAKTEDLQNWTSVTSESTTSTLFADVNGNVVSYAEAFSNNAVTGAVSSGNSTVNYGTYDIAAWIGNNTVAGNMWAPDVIYNPTMNKWCMYLSLNGATWNSAIILLTADKVEGPYVYQGPVVFSGFSTTDSTKSFKDTDLELVIGEQEELPAKYQKIADSSWGAYWPHAIDPVVFYDNDKLWMAYGSWSGGIYILELDENTGLRDYSVKYASDYDTLGKSVSSDEYFGKKIAGGYYVSGEGAYIEKIGNYYYLFMSYGFLDSVGGYNMRVFRSENPDGPYVDGNGNSAIYSAYVHNYSNLDTNNNYGMKLMGNYKWSTMTKGEVAQGHNSAFVDDDGKAYVIYHTRFDDGTESHEVRTHQLFVNEDGWLVAAPYEYAGETISATGYTTDEVVGTYGMITHDFQIDYANREVKTEENITLKADGTITGAYTGTWTATANTPYVTLTIGEKVYKGVFTEQVVSGSNITVMCFTAVSAEGLSIWGSGEPTAEAVVAQNAVDSSIIIPTRTIGDLELPTEGLNGATITWTSDNTAVLGNDGKVSTPAEDTVVTLTKKISKGDYYFEEQYKVTVLAEIQNSIEDYVVGKYYTNDAQDLSKHLSGTLSVPNPFYEGTTGGLDLSGGVTIEFDAVATGDVHVLGTIFSFMGEAGANGRLYFTPGSYLGYNATGGYFDANLLNYGLVKDYIGTSAHVEINITSEGFTVTVNDEVAYTEEILTTENGAGSVTDYQNVLNWLQTTADTLYFGHGSWWNAAGYDEANISLSNVVCSVGPVNSSANTTDSVSYTKDKVVLTTNADLTVEDNPFYGKKIDNAELKFTINMTEGTAQNGWDGIFSFYNSSNTGRVSIHTAPYVCYNMSGKWIDINQPGVTGGTDVAPSMVPGTEYDVVISINTTGVTMTVDGEKIAIGTNGSGASYTDLLNDLTSCDQLTWGVGLAKTAFWNTEQCTLTNISFTSVGSVIEEEEEQANPNPVISMEEITLAADSITYIENPFENAEFDELSVEYTINFDAAAPKNGWDGIFSFYNSTTGGRVSFQTAPYVCYNDMVGNWIDINQPGDAGATINQYGMVTGEDYDVNIIITKDSLRMFFNGVEVPYVVNGGSGASYADLLAFIAECDQFTWGVGLAKTAFWNTEVCTLKNVEISTHVPAMEKTQKASVELTASDALEVTENPYYGQDVEEMYIEYTINFAEAAAKNGWDGIFSFYNSETTGRISFQTAPYVCYNEMLPAGVENRYIDINSPALTGTNVAAGAEKGQDITFGILITKDKVTMTANGEEIAFAEGGSGATYADLLAYISECDQLTYGVGTAATAYWWTELCALSNISFVPASVSTVVSGNGAASGAARANKATLTAEANVGNEFVGWYADNLLIGTSETLDVTACKTVEITAKFEALPMEEKYEVAATLPESVLTEKVMEITKCKTIEELIVYLKTAVQEMEGATSVLPDVEEANIKVVDIAVLVSFNEGVTWEPATSETFPKDGIDVMIPYPENTNQKDYNFVIGHMFTSGDKVGQMEFPTVTKTAEGLKIHITSASPFVIGWKAIETEPVATATPAPTAAPSATEAPAATATPSATAAPVATAAPEATAVPVVNSTSPKTYDDSVWFDVVKQPEEASAENGVQSEGAVKDYADYTNVDVAVGASNDMANGDTALWLVVLGVMGVFAIVIAVSAKLYLKKDNDEA